MKKQVEFSNEETKDIISQGLLYLYPEFGGKSATFRVRMERGIVTLVVETDD